VDNVNRLVDAGVLIAVHGLGGRPEDLAYLEDLPVSAVRLTAHLGRPPTQRSGPGPLVAKATRDLITLVHLAAATVTVDGIQTRQQATWWLRAGADAATGPLFAQDP
jgi:EAL domain-containing protein (putative c-di-GMP-specific phosphodiesterase class I)